MNFNIVIAILLIFLSISPSHAVPLSTKSRWIVDDETGKRVKLACANWEGHVSMLPEGLNKQPLDQIARRFALMGFNCVRLTYATYMFTHHAHLTVAQNFENNNLTSALKATTKYNPQLLGLTLVDAQKAVVEALASHGVMVFLDNQVSKPMWCCNDDDGNGFFGDQYFSPQDWLKSLSMAAKTYKDTPMVMAMSLRNELRGPLQNRTVWYKYVERGAKLIHSENPNVLVLISGLDYDIDFTFLKNNPINLNLNQKLVYETHRYAFTEGQLGFWTNTSINYMCKNITQEIESKSGFLKEGKDAAPLFLTEFGINQSEDDQADSSFVSCLLAWMAKNDLDWAIWAGQGSYYLRDGLQDPEETYGMFDQTWKKLRNPEFHTKLQLVQETLQDPFSNHEMHKVMYHPLSGTCGSAHNHKNQVRAGDCWKMSEWSYMGEGTPIRLKGTDRCLMAVGDGLPVLLTDDCSGEPSAWKLAENSIYQLANKDENGNELCLDFDPHVSKMVLTRKCIVAKEDDPDYIQLRRPESQWFLLVDSNAK